MDRGELDFIEALPFEFCFNLVCVEGTELNRGR